MHERYGLEIGEIGERHEVKKRRKMMPIIWHDAAREAISEVTINNLSWRRKAIEMSSLIAAYFLMTNS